MHRNWAACTILALAVVAQAAGLPSSGPQAEGLPRGAADHEGEEKLLDGAKALAAFFATDPEGNVADLCSPLFLKALQENRLQLQSILSDFHAKHGRVASVRLVSMTAPFAGEMEFVFAKGSRLGVALALDGKPPHKIVSLLFRGVRPDNDKIEDVLKELRGLPGKTSLAVMRLDPAPKLLWELNPDAPLAVASAFKLYVLGALAHDVANGKSKWADIVALRDEHLSLPSGLLQAWPKGAPVTLHSLAALMISRSDNTATDHVIHHVGRGRVEAFQATMGAGKPELNMPLLTTGELFKLKLVLKQEESAKYVQADADGRRKLLEQELPRVSLAKPRPIGEPVLIEHVEWFFSAADLCRAMDWLRKHVDPAVRDILAVNPGITLDKTHWTYVGYKGGAEPGVLNYTLLLRDKDNAWFAVSITWNDPKGPADQTRLVTLLQRTLWILQKGH
jgi:beta-lactamase class A